jgi:hypothetical protein
MIQQTDITRISHRDEVNEVGLCALVLVSNGFLHYMAIVRCINSPPQQHVWYIQGLYETFVTPTHVLKVDLYIQHRQRDLDNDEPY